MITDLKENGWINNFFVEVVKLIRVDGVMTRRGRRLVYLYLIRDNSGECYMKIWLDNPSVFVDEYVKPGNKIYVLKGFISEFNHKIFVNVNGISNLKIVI